VQLGCSDDLELGPLNAAQSDLVMPPSVGGLIVPRLNQCIANTSEYKLRLKLSVRSNTSIKLGSDPQDAFDLLS